MPYFKIDMSRYDFRLPQPGTYMLDVIFENNTKVSTVTGMFPMEAFVIECENKPRDMPIFGIFWLEAHLTQRAADNEHSNGSNANNCACSPGFTCSNNEAHQ